jgi:type II secretory pathway predicted ATPase ExeA
MYLNFFGFKKGPFHSAPDPEFLYLSHSQWEALGVIAYGVEWRMGFVEITGAAGVGKTTIIRSFMHQADKDRITTIAVPSPNLSFDDLLKTLFRELRLEASGSGDPSTLLEHLFHFLIEEHRRGRNVVVIIDDAQDMPLGTLEQLPLFANLENDGLKLLQVVLVGQNKLETMLKTEELKQINQLNAVRTELVPLSYQESLDYIKYRLAKVTIRGGPVFTPMALRKIAKHCKGLPRTINIVCDNSLLTACSTSEKPVPLRVVNEVIADIERNGTAGRFPWSKLRRKWGLLLASILLSLVALWISPQRRAIVTNIAALRSFGHHTLAPRPGELLSPQEEPSESNTLRSWLKVEEVPEPTAVKALSLSTIQHASLFSQKKLRGPEATDEKSPGSQLDREIVAPQSPKSIEAPLEVPKESAVRMDAASPIARSSQELPRPAEAEGPSNVNAQEAVREKASQPDPVGIIDWLLTQRPGRK